ncbi:hypothetical protein RRF57_008959 [Xylaria bambusicola]|uniref:Uncharacterized protein n=1 Tax=Xylaria bambusicola TaxID=326684 RepID=A0AAN7Z162_9PEZI
MILSPFNSDGGGAAVKVADHVTAGCSAMAVTASCVSTRLLAENGGMMAVAMVLLSALQLQH